MIVKDRRISLKLNIFINDKSATKRVQDTTRLMFMWRTRLTPNYSPFAVNTLNNALLKRFSVKYEAPHENGRYIERVWEIRLEIKKKNCFWIVKFDVLIVLLLKSRVVTSLLFFFVLEIASNYNIYCQFRGSNVQWRIAITSYGCKSCLLSVF